MGNIGKHSIQTGAQTRLLRSGFMAEPPDEVMSLNELATYLKVSKSTLYKLVQQREIPGQKVGKQWRFHKSAVDDWLRANPQSRRGDDIAQDDGA